LSFYYLFAKPAREANTVETKKIITTILGEEFDQPINTTTEGQVPGDSSIPGWTGGSLKIANQPEKVIYQ